MVLVNGALSREPGQLLGCEGLAPRIGQEPLQAPRQMGQVKTDRRGTSGPSPQLRRREMLHDGDDVFADLQQCMGSGLEQRLDAGNRAAKPDFDRNRHPAASIKIGWNSFLKVSQTAKPRKHGRMLEARGSMGRKAEQRSYGEHGAGPDGNSCSRSKMIVPLRPPPPMLAHLRSLYGLDRASHQFSKPQGHWSGHRGASTSRAWSAGIQLPR